MPSLKSSPKPSPSPQRQWSFEAIGTQWWIGIYEAPDEIVLENIQKLVAQRIEAFDAVYSRFRPDSVVTAMSKRAGTFTLPADAMPLLQLYRRLYDSTGGQITPLVGQLLSDAGYDADYSLRPGKLRPVPDWDDVMQFSGATLTTSQPLLLDFGAAGKGYLVDLLCELLESQKITSFCIDASGDLRAHGLDGPLRIGMEDPANTSQAIGVVELTNQALCASAPQRRQWQGYHHIMNPQTLESTTDIAAVWTVADTCALADGLSTALFFTNPDLLHKQFTFEYAVMYADNSIMHSPGLPAELFT